MRVGEAVFACHSKACAPPPAGRGGSDKAGYVKGMMSARKNTTVTRDGNIAVTNGGGKMPRFKTRADKKSAWQPDHATTKSSAARIREILREAVNG